MTEQELDKMMRRVLMDALTLDEETAEDTPEFEPSLHHQREIGAMLKDPARWAKQKKMPTWKRIGRRAAAIVLAASLGLAVASPTTRAAVFSYVVNWYESYVDFRHAGDDALGELPDYEIAALPESYHMIAEQSLRMENHAVEWYEDEVGNVILLEYAYMQDGTIISVDMTGAEVTSVTVNGMEGFLFRSPEGESKDSTITWISEADNMQFSLSAVCEENDLLRMAESVKVGESSN